MSRNLFHFNDLFNLHDVTGQDRGKWIYSLRIDSAERFTFSFMYRNTQFRMKTQSTFRMKLVDSSLLVRLHWSIQNSSCTFNVPMFHIVLLGGRGEGHYLLIITSCLVLSTYYIHSLLTLSIFLYSFNNIQFSTARGKDQNNKFIFGKT